LVFYIILLHGQRSTMFQKAISVPPNNVQPKSAVNYVNKTQSFGCQNTEKCPTDAKKLLLYILESEWISAASREAPSSFPYVPPAYFCRHT